MNSVGNSSNKHIKVIASGGLGDCLLLTPFIRYFKLSGKYKRILCAFPQQATEIFDHNPHIDQRIPCKGKELLFWALQEKNCDIFSPYRDAIISDISQDNTGMNANFLPANNYNLTSVPLVHQIAESYGFKLEDDSINIFTQDDDEKWAQSYVKRWKGKRTVLFNAQSRLKGKNLSKSSSQKIINRLIDRYVVINLGNNPSGLKNIESIQPVPSIRKSAALFKRLDCIVSVDSFPGHLAYAVGTPAVVLFGPSNPKTFGHKGNCNIRVSTCPPCADTKRRVECRESICLEEIPVETIMNAVLSFEKCSSRQYTAQ